MHRLTNDHSGISWRGGAGDEVSEESRTVIHPVRKHGVGLGRVLLVVFVPQHLPCDFSRLQAKHKERTIRETRSEIKSVYSCSDWPHWRAG